MKMISSSKLKDISIYLNENNYHKIFILVGKNSFQKLNIKSELNKYLINKKVKYYEKKSAYPELKELINITKSIDKFNPNLLIAIGGGSVIDYAKISSVLKIEENLKEKIIFNQINFKKKYRLLAIPTTAGSGAEVTANAVIYIDKVKHSLENKNIKPDDFFLIPELVNIGSRKIKSSSGFDAIAQSIESIISVKSNLKSLNFASASLKISLNNYINFINKPNPENIFAMCISANLAGKAISISKTTAPHAVSYPFTSIFGISHGHAVSLSLGKFLKFNYKNMSYSNCNFDLKKRFSLIFELTKTANINELIFFLNKIQNKANLESNFKKLNININKDLPKILEGINEMRLNNNPIKLTINDVGNILKNNS